MFSMSSLTMDEQDAVFGTPFPDWDFSTADTEPQAAPRSRYSLFAEFQTIPNDTEPHSLDRIGWQLYFPNKDMRSSGTIVKHTRCLEKHYANFRRDYPISEVEHCRSFVFKVHLARNDLYVKDAWPTFESDLQEYPEYTIACIGLAMYRSVMAYCVAGRPCSSTTEIPKVYPRLHYFDPVKPIGTIERNSSGKLITVRGKISRVGQQYVNAVWSAYRCKYCNVARVVPQSHEVGATRRWTCSNCHARGGLEYSSASVLNRKETQRNITVQSSYSNALEVKVPDEIATNLVSGADVTITGILNVNVLCMYLQAVCIRINPTETTADRGVEVKFGATDLRAIRAIQSEPFPLKLLVHSICPKLKRMVTVKAGLLLALFSTSYDTHVLLAGSENDVLRQLLERCLSASPEGAWFNNSSQNNRSAVKRFRGGLYCQDAAGSVCCAERIDSLESVKTLEKILSDVEVPARITLLATASPVQGMFDPRKPFLDNFTLSRAFMEKFALVFNMEDSIDPEEDLVCPNGVRLHPEKPSTTKCSVEIPLVRQLNLQPADHFDPLPIELMRKYIDYARHNCNPEFSEDSTKLLEGFFSQMYSMPRWLNVSNGLKMAQIQNMVRARARIDLAAEITPQHVMGTIRIVSRSWYDKYDTDERDALVQLPTKKGAMKASTIRQFLDVLRSQAVQVRSRLFSMKDLRHLMDDAGLPGVVDEIVESLNVQGYLLKKSAGCYELLA